MFIAKLIVFSSVLFNFLNKMETAMYHRFLNEICTHSKITFANIILNCIILKAILKVTYKLNRIVNKC